MLLCFDSWGVILVHVLVEGVMLQKCDSFGVFFCNYAFPFRFTFVATSWRTDWKGLVGGPQPSNAYCFPFPPAAAYFWPLIYYCIKYALSRGRPNHVHEYCLNCCKSYVCRTRFLCGKLKFNTVMY